MPGFSPQKGEGAFSTGLMVPVLDVKNVLDARAVVELLEKNQIPALVNLEIQGIIFPWKDPPKNAAARVLVPSQMLPAAREILHRAGREQGRKTQQSSFGMRITTADVPPPPRNVVEMRVARVIPAPAHPELEDDEEDTGPIDLVLPEPSPLNQRLLIALIGIALGTAFQRLAELAFGAPGAYESFAARAPVWSEAWRLVTSGFMHNGPEHFIGNAIFGIVIGVVLFGTHRIGATAFVWLAASAIGMVTEASLTTRAVLIAGASAGNYGLLGLWANGQLDRARRSLLPRREKFRTIGILLILMPGALTPISSTGSKIAVLAHLGGFAGGLLLGFFFKRRLIERELAEIARRSRIAFIAAVMIVAVAFGAALWSALS
jgi:membrane associated rhomboid family serine protease